MAAATAGPSATQPPPSYLTPKPTAIAQGRLGIDHPQLRDLLVCRQERGLVSYLKDNSIVEQNLLAPGAPIRTVLDLPFTPSSLNAIALGPNDEDILYAAGGSWHADLHLSYHQANGSSSPTVRWQTDTKLNGTLNNSVLLTKSPGSVEPRVGVTNNDCTFRMYECGVRRRMHQGEDSEEEENSVLQCVGGMALDTCANFASISPSGRTLLSVGDSPNLYLHNIRGSSRLTFYPIATLPLPLPTNTPPHYPTTRPSTFTASFSTSFSHDSLHFAVGSQEGVVGIWDIRHAARPMKVWQADKLRAMGVGNMGAATGSISWDPSDWFHSSAPAWSIRNVKFIGGNRPDGKEYLVFTEHTSLIHIVNAKTLEVEEIVRVPSKMADPAPPTPPMYSSDVPSSPLAYIQLGIPARLLSLGPANGRSSDPEEEDEDAEDDPASHAAHSGQDEEDEAGAVSEGGSLFSPSTLLDLAFSGFSAGQPSAGDAPDPRSNRRSSSRARRRRGLVFPYSAERLTPPPPPNMPLPIHANTLYPPGAGSSGRRTPSSVSTSSTRFRRSSRTRINKSRTCDSNPEYIISDGYAFPAETAELDYRRLDSEDGHSEEDPLQLEQGLDIAGMCSDPTGRWLYVGTSRGVVEWGLV